MGSRVGLGEGRAAGQLLWFIIATSAHCETVGLFGLKFSVLQWSIVGLYLLLWEGVGMAFAVVFSISVAIRSRQSCREE